MKFARRSFVSLIVPVAAAALTALAATPALAQNNVLRVVLQITHREPNT